MIYFKTCLVFFVSEQSSRQFLLFVYPCIIGQIEWSRCENVMCKIYNSKMRVANSLCNQL